MRIAWLEVPHPGLGYYSALVAPLQSLGHNISVIRAPSARGFPRGALAHSLEDKDVR